MGKRFRRASTIALRSGEIEGARDVDEHVEIEEAAFAARVGYELLRSEPSCAWHGEGGRSGRLFPRLVAPPEEEQRHECDQRRPAEDRQSEIERARLIHEPSKIFLEW